MAGERRITHKIFKIFKKTVRTPQWWRRNTAAYSRIGTLHRYGVGMATWFWLSSETVRNGAGTSVPSRHFPVVTGSGGHIGGGKE